MPSPKIDGGNRRQEQEYRTRQLEAAFQPRWDHLTRIRLDSKEKKPSTVRRQER